MNLATQDPAGQADSQRLAVLGWRDGEELRIGVHEYRGNWYASARIYWRASDGAWHPTKRGVTVPADQLDELIDGLRRCRVELEGIEVIDRAA